MKIAVCFLMVVLGGLSAFTIFGMSFNGYPFGYQIGLAVVTAIGSAVIGRSKSWATYCACFYVPHFLLFAILVMGALEKGGWLYNMSLVAAVTFATWAPAWVTSKR